MDSTQRTRPRTGGSPVGLVIFIILTVVFAVLAYWAFAKFQQADQSAKELQAKLTNTEATLKKTMDDNKAFQQVAGVNTADALTPDIKNALAATRAEGIGDISENPTVSDVLRAVPNTIAALKNVQEGLGSDVATLTAQNKTLAEQKKANETSYEAELAARIAEVQAVQKTSAEEINRLQTRIDQEVADREALRDIYYTERDNWRKEQTKMVLRTEDLRERLRRVIGEEAVIEKADATITAIDHDNKLVTIDIGADKNVKPQMRFVVFTFDQKKQPVRKGVMEVVKVLPKVAIGQILSVEPDMAIGKGDSVYNLAGPQKKLFVFAGEPKIYSTQQWTNFIRANGGEVVDEVQKGDQIADYLITCVFDPQDPQANKLILDARDFGVKILKESELQDLMALK